MGATVEAFRLSLGFVNHLRENIKKSKNTYAGVFLLLLLFSVLLIWVEKFVEREREREKKKGSEKAIV